MFKVAFLGRDQLGMLILQGLLANEAIEVPVIISAGSSPEAKYQPSDFEQIAKDHKIDYHFCEKTINTDHFEGILQATECDLVVALLWPNTIGQKLIQTSRLGFLNCHSGLLPLYRGNACFNWAILNDEKEVGITVHFMDAGKLDTGAVILQETFPLNADTTVEQLSHVFQTEGARLTLEAVTKVLNNDFSSILQLDEQASYCYPRIPEDGDIDWNQPAADIMKLVRAAGKPYPGAYTYFSDVRDARKIKKLVIWGAHVEKHPLEVYHAVPGHILKFDKGQKWGVVCGDKALLILDEVSIDGEPITRKRIFKTVRQRLGLSTDQTLAALQARLEKLEAQANIAQTADNFIKYQSAELERYLHHTQHTIQEAVGALQKLTTSIQTNPIRNYSFQKGFYQWEQREVWYGVQVYQSFEFTNEQLNDYVMGLWFFSVADKGIEKRVYLALKSEASEEARQKASTVFQEVCKDYPIHQDQHQTNSYGVLPNDSAPEKDLLIQLAQTLYSLVHQPNSSS